MCECVGVCLRERYRVGVCKFCRKYFTELVAESVLVF